MKKVTALLLSVLMIFGAFALCGCDDNPPVETTGTGDTPNTSTVTKEYKTDGAKLIRCTGQSDKDGVYTMERDKLYCRGSVFRRYGY